MNSSDPGATSKTDITTKSDAGADDSQQAAALAHEILAVIDRVAQSEPGPSATGTDAAATRRVAGFDAPSRSDDQRRISELELRATVDRHVIEALVERGMDSEQQLANLKQALSSARLIGMAVGVVMQAQDVDESRAFDLLSAASHTLNRKVRDVAEDVVGRRKLAG